MNKQQIDKKWYMLKQERKDLAILKKKSNRLHKIGTFFLFPWWLAFNLYTPWEIDMSIGLIIQIWLGLVPIIYAGHLIKLFKKKYNY